MNNIREVKNFLNLKFIFEDNNNDCLILKNNKIISKIDVSSSINNGEFDLDQFLPKLEQKVVDLKETKVKISLNDNLFERIRIQDLKVIGNRVLKFIEIALTPRIQYITSAEEKLKIIKLYHDNPIYGGHPGIKRLIEKIKNKYSWKNMSKDVKTFVKKCKQCQTNKPINKSIEKMTFKFQFQIK